MARRGTLPTDAAELAAHLTGLTDAALSELETELLAEVDALAGDNQGANLDAAGITNLTRLTDQIVAVRTETATPERAEARQAQMDARTQAARDALSRIRNSSPEEPAEVETAPDGDSGDDGDAGSEDGDGGAEGGDGAAEGTVVNLPVPAGSVDVGQIAAAVAREVATSVVAALAVTSEDRPRAGAADYLRDERSLNRHLRPQLLAAGGRLAPDPQIPRRAGTTFMASADIPGVAQGSVLADITTLGRAMHERARLLPEAAGNGAATVVASMQREFTHTIDENTTHTQVDAIMRAATDTEALVSAGGWCAPSEISYNFFNLVAEEGMVDLPSIGILTRGGIKIPTSPSFADVIAASPDGLWTWTETDDQAAVTGSPVKDCVRPTCPTHVDTRLACDGLCMTVGNLTDYAWPENTANYLRLLMAARYHLTNTRILGIMQNATTNIGAITGPTGGLYGDLMNAVSLVRSHIINKFVTSNDQIVEFVYPQWVLDAVASDWARRTGVDDPTRAAGQIIADLNDRRARVQFVQDFQVRATGQPGASTAPTTWPATVTSLAYLPGTFVRGNGLNLNLGVVRDSVLNATNDHTAAWMEDCYAIAQPGWTAYRFSHNICVAGTTGAANISCS